MASATSVSSRIHGPRMEQNENDAQFFLEEEFFDSSENMEADELYEMTEHNTINILIIGETGVGKSTFINAFANYLKFDNLDHVENEIPQVLIPCKFTVTDENYELRVVRIGSDENELNELGKSSTQDPMTYSFSISNGQKFVRLIDTPGIGDTRGIDQDTINCNKIINYIEPLKIIHGIMFLLKPNSTKITVLFEFCLKQILSKLEKSASKNLLFVFTNTRGTCYRPGETLPCLRKVLEDIANKPPNVKIPLSKGNIFCLDNEAFRYLAAKANGVQFTARERQYFSESWEKSAEESWRMIFHITGDDTNKPLEPHQVANTMCLNEARGVINQLKQPMADITQLIQDQLRALQRHTELLELDNLDIKDLKKNLYIPIIDIEVMELPQPVTVCTSMKCAKIYKVRDVDKWHYIQRCHNPCYLKNVPREMIGAPDLLQCWAMNGSKKCRMCFCDFSTHMHIYYESKTVDKTIENDNVKKTLNSKEEVKKEKEKIIREMKEMKDELEDEHKKIIHYIAKFAKFLQQNAITPYNDVYKPYINILIDREKSCGDAANWDSINYLEMCKQEYDEAMKLFDKVLTMNSQDETTVTPKAIKESVDQLFKLKHNGAKIKELYYSQQLARKSENMNNFKPRESKSEYSGGYSGCAKKESRNGIFNHYSSKIKNYFTRSNYQDDAYSNEDNSSYQDTNATEWNRNNRKGKGRHKQNPQNNGYEDHLQQMQKQASEALAVLTSDLNKL